jgi:hypothetical protein
MQHLEPPGDHLLDHGGDQQLHRLPGRNEFLVMIPGDRIREIRSGRYGFVLYESNVEPGEYMVRFDGLDYNTVIIEDRCEVLPSEPFRAEPASLLVTVKYHVAHWPYDTGTPSRSTTLYNRPTSWIPATGAIVDEIRVS